MNTTTINGAPPTVAALVRFATVNIGHFTTMQVRGGGVRGLAHHLHRLERAHREVYGHPLDADLLTHSLRASIADDLDARVRITVTENDSGEPLIMVTVAGPTSMPTDPARLRTAPFERPLAHVKHVGTFGQFQLLAEAKAAGFDDVVFVGRDETVMETSFGSLILRTSDGYVIPAGRTLPSVTTMLVEEQLAAVGTPLPKRPVPVAELRDATAAVLLNSSGLRPVAAIDTGIYEAAFADSQHAADTLRRAYEAVPFGPVR
jgi:branched-subunit amino acid aminotransferase/4-amino-4-deoxychorismate lyase